MNSELEKLIEKYRITVNGLADLESGYEKVIKERGFVTLNGLLAGTGSSSGEGTENTVNAENAPGAGATGEGSNEPSEPTPVVPAPAPVENPSAPVENPGVTPVPSEPAVSDSTNLGTEIAGGESAATDGTAADAEESSEENSEENSEGTGRKPKKKK